MDNLELPSHWRRIIGLPHSLPQRQIPRVYMHTFTSMDEIKPPNFRFTQQYSRDPTTTSVAMTKEWILWTPRKKQQKCLNPITSLDWTLAFLVSVLGWTPKPHTLKFKLELVWHWVDIIFHPTSNMGEGIEELVLIGRNVWKECPSWKLAWRRRWMFEGHTLWMSYVWKALERHTNPIFF